MNKAVAYMVVDVESTGTDKYTSEIFDIAVIVVDIKHEVITIYNKYIRLPEELIDKTIQELGHIIHIDKDAIMAAESHKSIAEELTKLILNLSKYYKLKFVAHNALFDYQMISEMYRKYNKEQHALFIEIFNKNNGTIVDTIALIKGLYPNIKKYSLDNISKVLDIDPDLVSKRVKHNALLDCQILVALLNKVMKDRPFTKI